MRPKAPNSTSFDLPRPLSVSGRSGHVWGRIGVVVGIDLGDVVIKHDTSLPAWAGKRVAFDAWNVLYQFLSNIRQPDGTPLKDRQGRITSHLAGIMYRTSNLVEAGIKPVFVFDGEPHFLKRETLATRSARRDAAAGEYEEALAAGDMEKAYSKAQQTSRMTSAMADEAMELMQALGIPVVKAPGEGEAQAAWMAAEGHVHAVASQDFDTLLFGAPVLLRNLTLSGRRKLPGKQVWVDVAPERIDLQESLAAIELSREQLIDAALLVGTDFHPGIKGIGPKKALQIIQKESSLEAVIERLSAGPEAAKTAAERAILEQHAALAERETVRQIFRRPDHTDDFDVAGGRLDRDAVLRIMVQEHDFSEDRIEGALKKFGAGAAKAQQKGLFEF